MTPSWTTRSFIEYEHLTGAAGDNPVITTRDAREREAADPLMDEDEII